MCRCLLCIVHESDSVLVDERHVTNESAFLMRQVFLHIWMSACSRISVHSLMSAQKSHTVYFLVIAFNTIMNMDDLSKFNR